MAVNQIERSQIDLTDSHFHSTSRINRPLLLAAGTMLTHDIERARLFYEEYCGLETVRHRPDGLLVRDSTHRDGGPYWYLEVSQSDKIEKPQNLMNHWGIDVIDDEAVDRARAAAIENKEKYGIKRVLKAQMQHGAYAFYLADLDDNWWEVKSGAYPPVEKMPNYDPGRFQRD